MAKRNTPAVIAQIILDRFRGVTQTETAERIGLKSNDAVSRICQAMDLDALELEIRALCSPAGQAITPEVMAINAEHAKQIRKVTKLLDAEVAALEAPAEPGDDKPKPCKECGQLPNQPKPLNPLERVQLLNSTIAGYDKSHSLLLKAEGLESEAKRMKKAGEAEKDEVDTAYDALIDGDE